MKNEEEMIAWIDNASYEGLLAKWRLAPSGSMFFVGKIGKHFKKKMAEKRLEVGEVEHTRISKIIGWGL